MQVAKLKTLSPIGPFEMDFKAFREIMFAYLSQLGVNEGKVA